MMCPNYFSCRLATAPVGRPVIREEAPKKPAWVPKRPLTPAIRKVLKALGRHPKGLTVRELSIETGLSARHVRRVVKLLHHRGVLKKQYELRREAILKTDLTHVETTEVIHRYVLVNRLDSLLGEEALLRGGLPKKGKKGKEVIGKDV